LVALAVLLWSILPYVAGKVLQVVAERVGLINSQFVVRRLSFSQMELAQAQFALHTDAGPAKVRLERLQVNYRLWGPALTGIEIGWAKVIWHQANSEIATGSLEPVAIPLERLVIQRLELEVDTLLGRSVFSGKVELKRGEDGAVDIVCDDATQAVRATLAPAGKAARVVVTRVAGTPVVTLEARALDQGRTRATLRANVTALLEWLLASSLVPDKVRTDVAGSPLIKAGLKETGIILDGAAETATGNVPTLLTGQLIQQDQSLLMVEARLSGKGPADIDLRLDAPAPVLFDLAGPLLPAALSEWRLRAGNVKGGAKLRWHKDAWSGVADIDATRLAVALGRFQIDDIGLALRVTDLSQGKARLNAELSRQGQTVLTANAHFAKNGPLGIDAQVDAPAPLLFELAGPVLPAALAEWRLLAGNVEGSAKLRWHKDAWSGVADVKATHLAATAGRLQIANAGLVLRVTDLGDRKADLSAELPFLQLAEGIKASDLTIRMQYHSTGLILEQARTTLFGGTLEVTPTTITPAQQPIPLIVRVQDIDLSQLLHSLKQEGLSGTGKISGELPLSIAAQGFEIHDGKLAGTTPGVLHYRGPAAQVDNIAFQALSHLLYHTVKATVNYQAAGTYALALRLEGNNPALLAGHPLALNLTITGQLPELLRASLLSGDFSRTLLEQVQVKMTEDAGSAAPENAHPPARPHRKPPSKTRRN
jgi:hypothetical protein